MHLSKNLKYLRKKKGYNQSQFGRMTEVSNATVSSYESGINVPGLDTAAKIASVLGVPLDILLNVDIEESGYTLIEVQNIGAINKDELYRNISKNIRYLRKVARMNQTELSERLEKTKEVISTYERGKTTPGIDVLIDVSRLFGVSLEDVVYRDIEMQGTTGMPVIESKDITASRLNDLLELRVKTLERELKRLDPETAKELGIL